jgi:hypothetical protein
MASDARRRTRTLSAVSFNRHIRFTRLLSRAPEEFLPFGEAFSVDIADNASLSPEYPAPKAKVTANYTPMAAEPQIEHASATVASLERRRNARPLELCGSRWG